MAVRERLREGPRVELAIGAGVPDAVRLRRAQRSTAWRLYRDGPGVALVRIEVEAEDVEQADVGIVVRVVLCVALIVHDLHRPVVAWPPTGALVALSTAVVAAADICGGLGVTWRIPAVASRVAMVSVAARRIGI